MTTAEKEDGTTEGLACWAYADYAYIVFTEFFSAGDLEFEGALYTVLNTRELIYGHDPAVQATYRISGTEVLQTLTINGSQFKEMEVLQHRTTMTGRNARVSIVSHQDRTYALKSVWEEYRADKTSELEIHTRLKDRNVRGIPVMVSEFSSTGTPTPDPPDSATRVAFQPSELTYEEAMSSMDAVSSFCNQSPSSSSQHGVYEDLQHLIQLPRRRVCMFTSECQKLPESSNMDPVDLLEYIRDAMICYYEVYRIGGLIQGDVTPRNILVVLAKTELIAGDLSRPPLLCKPKATICDMDLGEWIHSETPGREVRSGTLPFMAIAVSDDMEAISRRTIAHDLEPFFYVMLYYATAKGRSEADWKSTKLGTAMFAANSQQVATAKSHLMLTLFDKLLLEFHMDYTLTPLMECYACWHKVLFMCGTDSSDRRLTSIGEPVQDDGFRACVDALDLALSAIRNDGREASIGHDRLLEIDDHSRALLSHAGATGTGSHSNGTHRAKPRKSHDDEPVGGIEK
ncbi:hypothetical protein LTR53_005431 [Teratosphaeriaceae sp. CCFEE 6253]|nr:hypothetical protein LTR53_005431 [Teratosphaeriaceae sp. CCFEE 6253]